ncbi:SAM-dependent methyltransferase [Pelagicoccus mobilis]|uniref:Class I SAM-dependent methyltransferase n=1 Tax=Pelagicoccus mobilis TaxID=415221 RepID=A0A934S093_9BACT|nr:class I SAM-dependent methyltransferase [Pelagicoccus mobilis]MBK1879992.1 class I SAM-dependent methyltransferase [Pelagicoccus mobilis]
MNKWDKIFGSEDFAYGTDPNDFLAENAHLIPQGKVLCLADGEGRNGVHLASLGHQVISLDSSEVGLAKATKLAEQRGLEIEPLLQDLSDYRFPVNEFSGVVSIFCHLPPLLRNQVYSQVAQSLKPGGVLLVEAYTPAQLKNDTGGPPIEELLASLESLLPELKDLDIKLGHEIERDVVEGRLHTGKASVVQIIATKK